MLTKARKTTAPAKNLLVLVFMTFNLSSYSVFGGVGGSAIILFQLRRAELDCSATAASANGWGLLPLQSRIRFIEATADDSQRFSNCS